MSSPGIKEICFKSSSAQDLDNDWWPWILTPGLAIKKKIRWVDRLLLFKLHWGNPLFYKPFFCTFVIIFAHCSTAASTPNKECCWAKMVPVPFHQQLMGSCMLRISKEHNAATRATTTRIFFFAETDSRSWGHLGCFLFILPWQLMSVGLLSAEDIQV